MHFFLLCLFLIQFFFSFELHAQCIPDANFRKFIKKEKVLALDDIKNALLKFSRKKSKPLECVEQMAKVILHEELVQWKHLALQYQCFDFTPSQNCEELTRHNILINFSALEKKYLSFETDPIKKNYLNSPFQTSKKLTPDVVNILATLTRIQKLEDNLQLAINDCNETTSVQAEDSINFQYFKKLQLKGLEAPLEEFLRLWYPDENELLEDLYYSNCGKILKIYEYHNLDYLSENCKPDSLYSWGPVVKLENMKKILADGDAWYGSPNPYEGKPHTLFMAKTPVSTFGYGDIAIRIKLRIGTPFVYQHHTAYNQGIPDYTHVDGVMMNRSWHNDYMLDNSIFIESWSYATPQLYDEIIRDIVRIKSKLPAEIYAHNLSYDPDKGLENLFNQSVDEKDFSENELKRKLLIHIGMILRGEGRIHYQQGSCRNKDLHYKTNQPTYFNPK